MLPITKTDRMRQYLRTELADGIPRKARELYTAFAEKTEADGEAMISRGEFESFLRLETIRKSGMLKRTDFGVYQQREDPEDRGILNCHQKVPPAQRNIIEEWQELISAYSLNDPEPATVSEIMEEMVGLASKIDYTLSTLENHCDAMDDKSLNELHSIREATLEWLDRAFTGITCAAAWESDHALQEELFETQIPQLGMQL